MGVKNLVQNFPRVMKQESWRQSMVRGIMGLPAESKNEAALHDTIDLIPVIGDFPSFMRILTNKGNRVNQGIDAFVGAIPIAGDIADLLFTGDTNLKQFEMRPKDMGTAETVLSGKWFSNAMEKYVGGNEDVGSIWTDKK